MCEQKFFGKVFLFASVLILSAILPAAAQTGIWSGKIDVNGNELTLVFHLDEENPVVDSPDQGAEGIPVDIEKTAGGRILIKIPSIGASYDGIWLIRQIVGTFTQMNLSFPLTLTPGEIKRNRPQTPVGPFPYSVEEVSFVNGDVVLNGTLVLPEGYSRNTPVLVMVTGSGIQNRDEELYGHKPFAVIADALARAGFATLRYDDRGFGGYSGDINACTVEDFKNDALAGIDLLRERFDNVGVIGHSEGGTIALMLAAEQKADFIISLAGMVVSGAETLVWQNRNVLTSAGFPDKTVNLYCDLLSEAFDAAVNGESLPDPEDYDIPAALKQNYMAALEQIRTPYMLDFLQLDMRPLLASVECPVLALNGTKDVQVPHEINLAAISNALKDTEINKVISVDDVNHLFQKCTTGAVTEYREIEETISQDVLDTMAEWLTDLTTLDCLGAFPIPES